MIKWKKEKAGSETEEKALEISENVEQEQSINEETQENIEEKYIEEEEQEAEIKPLSKDETSKLFSSRAEKIQLLKKWFLGLFKNKKNKENVEDEERIKITDILSKKAIILISVAVFLVFAFGFFIGWALPVI